MAEIDWASMHKEATTNIEGDFPVVIVEAKAAKTQNDKEMIRYKAKIESGPYAGRTLTGQFTISPESPVALRIFFQQMAVLGLDAAFWAANPNAPTEQVAKTLEGRRAVGVVGVRKWQGQDREGIEGWKPALGGPGTASIAALGGLSGGPAGLSAGTSLGVSTPVSPAAPSPTATPATTPVTEPSTPAPDLPF